MTDIYDQASEREARDREAALQVRRAAGPDATGLCHNCAEQVPCGVRWCDLACLQDWQRRQRAEVSRG